MNLKDKAAPGNITEYSCAALENLNKENEPSNDRVLPAIETFDYEFLTCFDAVLLAKRGGRTIWCPLMK